MKLYQLKLYEIMSFEIISIVGCLMSAGFLVCNKFFCIRTVKKLPRVGRPKEVYDTVGRKVFTEGTAK